MNRIDRIKKLTLLLIDLDDFITLKKLSELLNVSSKTIQNDLNSNEFHKLIKNSIIIKKQNKGVFISNKNKRNILENINHEVLINDQEITDINFIICKLLTSKSNITVDYLCENLYQSYSYISNLIDILNKKFFCTDCQIIAKQNNGLIIKGKEGNIRLEFFKFYNNFVIENNFNCKNSRVKNYTYRTLCYISNEISVNKLVNIIEILEKTSNSKFTDSDFNNLLIQLLIMILRINNSNIYTDSEKDNLVNTKEYYLSELLKIYIEKDFCIKIDKCELKYLTNILSNKRHIDNNIIEVDQIIYIKKFLKSLSTRLNIDLTNDEFLIDNLSKHMKPAIERMKIGISSSNPLLDTVKSKYTDIYVSVITSIEEIEDYEHIYFDSNEIGYICLHIIAAINKPSNQIKYNTALICNEGLSVEIFLKNLIEISFNEIQINKIYRNLNVLTELDSKYDLILNSTNIILQSKKSINISTIPNKEDNIKINNFFLKKNKLSNNSSNKLLSFHLDSCENSYELIQKYCNYLTINNFTTDNFYQTVIQRFKISNTYIARGIALLHGSKSEVSESTLLVIKLNEVIEWEKDKVDLVFLVASNDKDSKEYSLIFRKLMKIIIDDFSVDKLKKCENLDDIKDLLEIY